MRKFKTESKRLLDLMINSIYTNKEIFLRELISNASDALDKVYLESLKAGDGSVVRSELYINVSCDKDARTITISDNGIGMDEEALEANLGTIAHSGSLEFKEGEDAKESDEIDIIGQFGVGFYSAFMVADHVKVVTKPYGSDTAYTWESEGLEGYSIGQGEREGRGTTITLTLREDSDEFNYSQFLNTYALQDLVKRYSDYVRYPIMMKFTTSVPVERPEDAPEDWKQEYREEDEVRTVNSMVPIWTKKKADVSDEEYNEFYKATFHDDTDPAAVISIHAEGTISYDALLFIPAVAPREMLSRSFKKGLTLYSSNVMIMDKCEELLPDYFGFVRGIVDSPDLSLNISREMLQQSKELSTIQRRIEKKIKAELVRMLEDDREKYEEIYKYYGPNFKFSIYSTYGGTSSILSDLLMFPSAMEGKMVTLGEYCAAVQEEQDKIYFATGDTVERLNSTPTVKGVVDKGFDVLLCTHDVDEFCLMSMGIFDGKQLVNVGTAELDLETEEEKAAHEKVSEENAELFADMAASLGDKVTKVVAS
ncbi:MAG: molecular chaperone HtpG, partial [Coriobacteriaceae bacterium]|nr:molecular chaperone HtpG [Coriobacteriaceae bacterium]